MARCACWAILAGWCAVLASVTAICAADPLLDQGPPASAAIEPVDAGDFKNRVAAMFASGDKATPQSLAVVKNHYEQLRSAGPADPRIDYAYALVLLRQRRYEDALHALSAVIEQDQANLPAYRAKIWIEMLIRKVPEALDDMDILSQVLAAADDERSAAKPAPKQAATARDAEIAMHIATAEFLGRVHGFLEYPAADSIAQATFARHRADLLARLPIEQIEAFESGRASVVERYIELESQQNATESAAKAQQQRKLDRERARLKVESQRVSEQYDKLNDKADTIESHAASQMSDTEVEGRRVERQLAEAMADAAPIALARAALQRDVDRTGQRADALLAQSRALGRNREPFGARRDEITRRMGELATAREQLLTSVRFGYMRLARYDAELLPHHNRINTLRARRDELLVRRGAVQVKLKVEGSRLANKESQLEQAQRRNEFQENAANRGKAGGKSSRVAAIASQRQAFSTYVKFAYADETERVLKSFEREQR